MKNLCATLILVLVLSGFANAGQIDTPPVVSPTPPPSPIMHDSSNGSAVIYTNETEMTEANVDPYMQMTFSLFQTFISIF